MTITLQYTGGLSVHVRSTTQECELRVFAQSITVKLCKTLQLERTCDCDCDAPLTSHEEGCQWRQLTLTQQNNNDC